MIRLFCQENENPFKYTWKYTQTDKPFPTAGLDYIIYSVIYHFKAEIIIFQAFLRFLSPLNANILSYIKII